MIVEVPVKITQDNSYLKNQIFVKVEIQLRTMAMDFWATNEHKFKYKSNKKISLLSSRSLVIYAKILNLIDNKVNQISKKDRIRNTI